MLYEIEHGIDGHWKEMVKQIPFCLGTNCKSLYDLCRNTGSLPGERRVVLDLFDVREGMEHLGDLIRWVPTDHMLVDCLTKTMSPDLMLQYLESGVYSFKYDEIKNTKRAEAKARKERKAQKAANKQQRQDDKQTSGSTTTHNKPDQSKSK